jgi:hypothetical protein
MTITVQISNSDNKLTQVEWSEFVNAIRNVLESNSETIHFEGGAPWDAPHQNACWVAELSIGENVELQEKLSAVRANFRQESVAVTIGETRFI